MCPIVRSAPVSNNSLRLIIVSIMTAVVAALAVLAVLVSRYAYNNIYYVTLYPTAKSAPGDWSATRCGIMFEHNGNTTWYGKCHMARFRKDNLRIWNDKLSGAPDAILSGVSNVRIVSGEPWIDVWPARQVVSVEKYNNWLRGEGVRYEKEFGDLLRGGWDGGKKVHMLNDWLSKATCSSDKISVMAAAFDKYSYFYDYENGLRRFMPDSGLGEADYTAAKSELVAALRTYYPESVEPEGSLPQTHDFLFSKKNQPDKGPLSLDLGEGVRMEFVWVAALNGWVGKYEVTNQEYRKFRANHNSGDYKGVSLNSDRQPVVQVSYYDAVEFSAWMNKTVTVVGGWKVRLPYEDEWMTFARCGDGREYPWGNEWPPKYGNYADATSKRALSISCIDGYDDGDVVTCVVNRSGENNWGLCGVGGNAMEHTSESDGRTRGGVCGGSWISDWENVLRCGVFYKGGRPSDRFPDYGFRLVVLPIK